MSEYKSPLTGLPTYKAQSWTTDNNQAVADGRYPGKFYMREEADALFKKMEKRRKFELRRARALERFYLDELGLEDQKGIL